MWSRRAPLLLQTRALGCYVDCDPIRYCSEYLKMEVVYIGACMCMFIYYICMYVWACGYMCRRVLLTLQRDKILSSCDHLVRVSFTPGECKSPLQEDLLLRLSWPWSRIDRGKIWHDSYKYLDKLYSSYNSVKLWPFRLDGIFRWYSMI